MVLVLFGPLVKTYPPPPPRGADESVKVVQTSLSPLLRLALCLLASHTPHTRLPSDLPDAWQFSRPEGTYRMSKVQLLHRHGFP